MNSHNEIKSASPDDTWIMCDSKSHPGLKFYVNKVTGIKVWNVTDTEIAFAEKAGRADSYSEPPGRPTMQPANNARILYNKQIINNQFSDQMPNLLLKSVRVCSPFNTWDNPQNQPPGMQTQQFYTIVPAAIAPINNQIVPNIQGYQQLLPQPSNLQNTSLPYYAQNQQMPQLHKPANWKRQNWYRRKSLHDQSPQENFNNRANQSDLRRKLVRRKYSGSAKNDKRDFEEEELSTRIDKHNWVGQGLADPSIQINLTPLKTITSKGSDSEQWCIVVDKDVILENYNFLINMAAADPNCHLLIPQHVMSELREHVSTNSDVPARRIVRFLTQQIESGLVMLGEEVYGEGISHKTILTCVKLASRDRHVILISNNEETLNYKPNIKDIKVFTMQDVKDILNNRLTRPRNAKSPTLDIRIVIPNNSFSLEDETTNQNAIDSIEIAESNVLMKSSMGVSSVDSSKTEDENPFKSDANCAKQFAETGVQTNIMLQEQSVDNSITDDQNPPKFVTNCAKQCPESGAHTRIEFQEQSVDNSKTDDLIPKDSDSFSQTGVTKNTLEIHSIDNSKSENKYPPDISENSSSSVSNVSLDTVRMKEIIARKRLMSKEYTLKVPKELSISNASKNRLATSEISPQKVHRIKSASTSTSCDNDNASEASIKRSVHENVIVDETSISAISNSESSHSEKVVSPPFNHSARKAGLRTVVMYGAVGQSMVDILKMRSDEWLFRFVQIMEEVLRVKLQEKLPFEHNEPAPWNLLEAARCIIKKFSDHFNVVDAANKLSFILYKTSDEQGKISEKIEPSDYMEMYSYGVFLVETFQDMSADCKEKDCKKKKTSTKYEVDGCSCYEVQAASESLKKLLYDIQNANLETFVENPHDLAMHNASMHDASNYEVSVHFDSEIETRKEPRVPEITESQQDEMLCDDIVFSHRVGTRSQKKKSQIKDNELPSKITINNATKLKFINSLHLQKKVIANKPDVNKNNKELTCANKENDLKKNKVPCLMKTVVQSPVKTRKGQEDLDDLKCHFSKDDSIDIPKSPSKVVCNFTVNPVFERKVKAKQNQAEYEVYAENEEAEENRHTVDMPTPIETDDCMPPANVTDEYMPAEKETVDCVPRANETHDFMPMANKKHMPTANETDDYMPTVNKTAPFMPSANKKHMPIVNEKYKRTANKADDCMLTADETLVPKANLSEHNNDISCEANEKFLCFIGRLTRRLGDVFTQVELLCDTYIKKVRNDRSDVSTRELHKKVEMACSFIGNIHKSLESISKRGLQDRSENIQKLLKIANIEDFIPDDKLCLEYRHVISMCTEQAKEFHDSLRGILKLVQR